jgi:hypothetical protein
VPRVKRRRNRDRRLTPGLPDDPLGAVLRAGGRDCCFLRLLLGDERRVGRDEGGLGRGVGDGEPN